MWIKICGLNDLAAAREIVTLRPDAVGINFYEHSARFVSEETARRITDLLPPEIDAIGVFVSAPADAIARTAVACRLDGAQCPILPDGDPFAEIGPMSPRCPDKPFKKIGVFSAGERGLAPLAEILDRSPSGRRIDACLVDAEVEGEFGGTGRRAPWERIAAQYRHGAWPRLILAGGLQAENVTEAIATVRPWGVDVASGVESSRGVKDPERVAKFIEAARREFQRLGSGDGRDPL